MTINDIKHAKVKAWVEEIEKLCTPDAVHVCDGSKEEYDALMKKMVDSATTLESKSITNTDRL